MKISHTLLFSCILVSIDAFAHADRILPIMQDGTLADIPSMFGPAKLKVKFSVPFSGSPPITSIVLNLGEKQTELPVCITSVLRSKSMGEVRAEGSWYHDEARLPYYLSLSFFDPGHSVEEWARPGYKLLFNLRTAKLITIEAQVVQDEGRSIQYLPVDLTSKCAPDVLAAITHLPAQ